MSRRHHHKTYGKWNKYRTSRHQARWMSYNRPRRIDWVKILSIMTILLTLGVSYLLLFNPPLPNGLLTILSPIIYVTEFLILVFGLMVTTTISRHGIGGSLAMIILGVLLMFIGLAWWFTSGFSPPTYYAYEMLFGAILGIIGLFTATYAVLFGQSIIHIR